MSIYKGLVVIVAVTVVAVGILAGSVYFRGSSSSPLIVYAADAYVQETNLFLSGFHNSTGIPVLSAKGGGSFTDAREIGQGDPSNAFVSVALQSYNKSFLGSRYSGWALAFASDQLVLAYSSNTGEVANIVSEFNSAAIDNSTSTYASAFSNLTSGLVKVGISDPSSDPAGLRGWLSLEIAGYLYAGGKDNFYTERLTTNGGVVNGSSAATLVSPLITGQIQFLFIYKSAAISKGLDYVELPSMLNFGDPSLSSFYSGFTYNTAEGLQAGSTIFIFITSLAGNGGLTNESLIFSAFVIENRMNLSSFGLSPLMVPLLYSNLVPPTQIQQMLEKGMITSAGRF